MTDMTHITFESHSTTIDNEAGRAAGWYDVELSKLGEQQARNLGERRKDDHFDVIYCSDLERSHRTAELAFGTKFPIEMDSRLRECNYGDMNRGPKDEVEGDKASHIDMPYPNGESWQQAVDRVVACLEDIKRDYPDGRVLVIGHRATQYGLEHFANNISVRDIALAPWHYQPGWEYEL